MITANLFPNLNKPDIQNSIYKNSTMESYNNPGTIFVTLYSIVICNL